jgi:hypothetical protein
MQASRQRTGRDPGNFASLKRKRDEMNIKRSIVVVVLALLLAVVTFACAGSLACPVHDGSQGTFTGSTQIIEGHLYYEYHCSRGHNFWARCN